MNHPLDQEAEYAGEGEESPARLNGRSASGVRDQEWAVELRKADQRSHEMRCRYEDLARANLELEERIKHLESSIETRDTEILRLGGLYQGGQANDKLAMQYH